MFGGRFGLELFWEVRGWWYVFKLHHMSALNSFGAISIINLIFCEYVINLNCRLILLSPHKTSGGVLISYPRLDPDCADRPTTH